jgi:hypothetical protein
MERRHTEGDVERGSKEDDPFHSSLSFLCLPKTKRIPQLTHTHKYKHTQRQTVTDRDRQLQTVAEETEGVTLTSKPPERP